MSNENSKADAAHPVERLVMRQDKPDQPEAYMERLRRLRQRNKYALIVAVTGRVSDAEYRDESIADALFIAAAPEMYEALEEVIRKCEQFKNNGANANDYRHVQSIAETARAALIEYREMSR